VSAGWLGGRWAVGAAAWAAFSAAVWFAGDTLVLAGGRPLDGPAERLGLIAALAAAWLGWELRRARKSLRENARLLEGLAGGTAGEDSAERAEHEISVLRKRFEDALAVLRKARFRGPGGERRTVAELPWYMFIGAPGSGKTTALLNAGLRFPLGDPRAERALQGVGGTRNCDWWFTDEAVLLDTAGRYTTQESDREADSAAWLGFLELLKQFRPRQPLNGVIVTLSVADLTHWTEDENLRYAGHVRERVWELYTRLGVRLPVYVMVTKADLLAGFNEFFAEFDAERRAQVWGATFDPSELPSEARPVTVRLDEELAHLERRLYALLPGRLQEERDLQRRAAIYRFPQQFRSGGPPITSFLDAAFGSGWASEPPLLRGVYFASGTQEGSPIDRVLGTLARSFNLERKVQPPNIGSGKSFFLRRLLREVIFGEAGLAGMAPGEERRLRLARMAAYAAVATLSVALALAWTASFLGNRALVAAAGDNAGAAKRELDSLPAVRAGDEARLVALLSRLRELRQADSSRALHWGLYQGEKLDAQAERAYRNMLHETLLPHLADALEVRLRTAPSREAFEGYVALYDASRDSRPVEQAAVALWQLPEKAQRELAAHLRAALAEAPLALPRGRDDALIDSARRKLASGAKT
jgi:type VI secretion system protein ImpL